MVHGRCAVLNVVLRNPIAQLVGRCTGRRSWPSRRLLLVHGLGSRAATTNVSQMKLEETGVYKLGIDQRLECPEREAIKKSCWEDLPPPIVRAIEQIHELTKKRQYEEALQLFRDTCERLNEDSTLPKAFLYNAGLNVCAKALWFDKAEDIWSKLPMQQRNIISYSTVIDLCRRLKRLSTAQQLFEEMRENSVLPNTITYTSMINVYGMTQQPAQAVRLFRELQKESTFETAAAVSKRIAFLAVMSAVARSGDYAQTRALFMELLEAGLKPDHPHFNTLITSCVHGKDSTTALGVFDNMKQWGLEPRVEDYTALISSHANDAPRAMEIFEEMRQQGIEPTGILYQALIRMQVDAGDGAGARLLLKQAGTSIDSWRAFPRLRSMLEQLERLPK